MKPARTLRASIVCLALGAALNVGCIGETILTAGAKVLNGQLNQLTVNELKLLNETTIMLLQTQGNNSVQLLTTEQAVAIVGFLQENDVTTLESLQALIEQTQSSPDSVTGLEEIVNAFGGDVDNQDELQDIFSDIFAS